MPDVTAELPDAVSGTGSADSESNGGDAMAALDQDSFLHWKEHLYKSAQRMSDGADFVTEAIRTNYMEGKVGYRESIAMTNLPPVKAPGT